MAQPMPSTLAELLADPVLGPAARRLARIQTRILIDACQREQAEQERAEARVAERDEKLSA